MPIIRRTNLSLGELGIATGQYGYSTNTMEEISASYVDNRPEIKLSWCNASDTSGPIKFSEFYGDVSGANAGKFGQTLPGDSLSGNYHYNMVMSSGTTVIQFQFENTGSKFHRIADRWQCYTKRKGLSTYWEINEETTNFQNYFDFDSSPVLTDDTQDQTCGINLTRPSSTTTTYYGSLSASFCDCFNYQFGGVLNLWAPYSQSAQYSVKKNQQGGGT